jgi:uncharacterized protein (TIGR03083 family)
MDYLEHVARESALFARAIQAAPPGARVPSCPDWDADDLLWHLSEVQWFWGTIVGEGVDGDGAEALKPPRPADRAALADFFTEVSARLSAVLAATAPDAPAWTWSEDHTTGFIRRRQAHEALIHRVDAELTAGPGHRTELDPRLSADGVDEVLRIMYGGDVPAWGTFTADPGRTIRLRAADTGDSWFATLGRFTGTSQDGTSYDEPALAVPGTDPGTEVAATISAAAADLDCWLWNRPPFSPPDRSGDEDVLAGFDALREQGITLS